MLSSSLRFVALASLFALVSACSGDDEPQRACTAIAVAGLRVIVAGAANPDGGTITVTATDGDYEEELECEPEGPSLVCQGARERPGTYVIEVVAGGDVVATEEVTVGEDDCHVITEEVTI